MLYEQLATAVALPSGYTIMPMHLDYLPAMVALYNAQSQASLGINDTSEEGLSTDLQMPGFDLANSSRVIFDPHGQMVGCAIIWDLDPIPVQPWLQLRVHPSYHQHGVDVALLHWGEERAQQSMARVPADIRVSLRAGSESSYQPMHNCLTRAGLHVTRHFYDMLIELDKPIPEAVWPVNIRIETMATYRNLHAIYAALDEAFEDHWGHVTQNNPEESVQRWQHWLTNSPYHQPELCFIAFEGNQIAGVALCEAGTTEDVEMGFVEDLAIRRPWRRQGLALALLHHTFAEFKRRGFKRVALGVDASSLTGATRLYEKAGMHVWRQFNLYEKELQPGRDLATRSVE